MVGASETDVGSVLILDDGTQVCIDVRPARLNEALIEYGMPPLAELIGSKKLGVFVGILQMTAEQWERTAHCIRCSAEAGTALSRFPSLGASFREPYAVIAAKPHPALRWIVARPIYVTPNRIPRQSEPPISLVSRVPKCAWRLAGRCLGQSGHWCYGNNG
jgi:hypothetical protein